MLCKCHWRKQCGWNGKVNHLQQVTATNYLVHIEPWKMEIFMSLQKLTWNSVENAVVDNVPYVDETHFQLIHQRPVAKHGLLLTKEKGWWLAAWQAVVREREREDGACRGHRYWKSGIRAGGSPYHSRSGAGEQSGHNNKIQYNSSQWEPPFPPLKRHKISLYCWCSVHTVMVGHCCTFLNSWWVWRLRWQNISNMACIFLLFSFLVEVVSSTLSALNFAGYLFTLWTFSFSDIHKSHFPQNATDHSRKHNICFLKL